MRNKVMNKIHEDSNEYESDVVDRSLLVTGLYREDNSKLQNSYIDGSLKWAKQCENLKESICNEVRTIQYMIDEESQVNLSCTNLLNSILKYEEWLGADK